MGGGGLYPRGSGRGMLTFIPQERLADKGSILKNVINVVLGLRLDLFGG